MTDPGHAERVLLARLATVNQKIARYVTQSLDADAGRTTRPTPTATHALGTQLRELADALQVEALSAGEIT